MSKDNKKNQGIVVPSVEDAFAADRDDEGFIQLKPTQIGASELEKIRKRSSKLTDVPEDPKTEEEAKETVPEEVYDPTPMSKLLDELEDAVKAGKYGKVISDGNRKTIKEFVNAYMTNNEGLTDSNVGMVKKFLSICKSYYEYDQEAREAIDNITYDGLLAKWLSEGNKEPVGIIPKGLKNLKKVEIQYPTLHNNVDKAYIVHANDTVPEGVKETDSVEAWLHRTYKELSMSPETELKVEISPKIDGVSINGTIVGDMLVNPQSRGDESESVAVIGMNGMAISTADFKAEEQFGLQYEAFVTEEDRVKASEYLGMTKPYISCRHAASGIIHRLSTVEDDNLLKFLSLYPIATEGLDGTYAERMDYIENFGIVPKDMPKRKVIKGTLNRLISTINSEILSLANLRENLSFAIDGLVITVYDDDYQKTLGRAGRTNKYQLALKFDPASAIATVRGVTLDCGKKGFRTPQVWFEHPVFLDGVRYDHVPVLSVELYEQLGLRYKTQVRVHRVGDVIPAITVVKQSGLERLHLPERCPSCGKKFEIRAKKLYCNNAECSSNVSGKFVGFFEKMDMVGYSNSFADLIHEKAKCNSIADLVSMTKDKFLTSGINLKIAMEFPDRLKEQVASKSDIEILGALGLPGVGKAKAKIILSMKKMEDLTRLSHTEALAVATAAVGEDQAPGLADVMTSPVFRSDVKAVIPLIANVTTDFNKKTRVGHTGGELSATVKAICKARGFEIVDGKSFDILITGSMSSNSGKMEKAKKNDLPIFLADDFIEQYKFSDVI